jgi:hypothetical protein
MELCWHFLRLLVVVEMRGDTKEYLGGFEVLFGHCLLQLQISLG